MTVLAEAMFNQIGFEKDAAGNYNPPVAAGVAGGPAPVPMVAPQAAAPARAASPAAKAPAPVAPVKATQPEADIPEPPVVGQASPGDVAATKKKSLLGG